MPSRSGWLLALALGVAAATAWSLVRASHHAAAPSTPAGPSAPDPHLWPGDEATLTLVAARYETRHGVVRLMIDPGHGALNNHGNTSSFCVEEQDAMLDLAEALAARLEATGHVSVHLTRNLGQTVEYSARLEEAAAWGADAFVSLHSDVRGRADRWSPAAGRDCPVATDAPGFAVLYSDEGASSVAAQRLVLGRAVARRMAEAGFLPYGGAAYTGTYAADEQEPGVFVDRHTAEQRIFVLRRAAMPSILVETHNALDPREATRWAAPETLDAFAAVLAAALFDALPSPGDRAAPVAPQPGGT